MSYRIYYIDDEELLCELFVELFQSDKIIIESFTTHEELLRRSKEKMPDLYFIDYRLKGINGDVLAKLLNPNIPKVLITGELTVAPTQSFVKIFQKPIVLEEVQDFILSLLSPIK